MRGVLRLVALDERGSRSAQVAAIALAVSATGTACSLLSQVAVAALVGAQSAYDSYVVAASLPIGLGAMVQFGATYGLVPRLAGADPDTARRLASQALTGFALAGAGAAVVLVVLAPQIVALLAPGFGPATSAEAALMLRLAAAGMAFDVARSVLVAAHVASGRAVLTQAMNVVWFTAWPLVAWAGYPRYGAVSLAAGYALAHGLIFGLLLLSAVRSRLVEALPWSAGGPAAQLLAMALPAAVALLVTQACPFVDRAVGSFLPGPTISYLTYATRPSDLFVRGVPQVLGLVFFPVLARHAVARDWTQLRLAAGRLLRLTLLVATLAAVLLMVLRSQALTLLYVRGAFLPDTAATVAGLLRWYAAAIVPLSALSVLVYLLCGLGRWWSLLLLGAASVVVAAVLDVALSRVLAVQGIAVSALCVAGLSAIGAAAIGERAVPGLLRAVPGGWLLRVGAAAGATLLVGTGLERVLPGPAGVAPTLVSIAVTGAALACVFLVSLIALRVPQTTPLVAAAGRLLARCG